MNFCPIEINRPFILERMVSFGALTSDKEEEGDTALPLRFPFQQKLGRFCWCKNRK